MDSADGLAAQAQRGGREREHVSHDHKCSMYANRQRLSFMVHTVGLQTARTCKRLKICFPQRLSERNHATYLSVR